MAYVFGPVPSRRLGLSLGVDLIRCKTCTYDCLYCQVGRTTDRTMEVKAHVPLEEVLHELGEKLEKTQPDTVTLAGSGEPTLHSQIDRVIAFVKEKTDTRVAVLTNGSLLWMQEVRRRVLEADILMPTLTTAFDKTFRAIHRAHEALSLPRIIEGLIRLRESYGGQLNLEVFLLRGFNDSDREVEALGEVIGRILPDRIQINTVARPPADGGAVPLDRERMEEIKNLFGPRAEIIADVSLKGGYGKQESLGAAVMEMVRRRPLRSADVAHALNISMNETEKLIQGLVAKGLIQEREHSGKTFYMPE